MWCALGLGVSNSVQLFGSHLISSALFRTPGFNYWGLFLSFKLLQIEEG